MATTGCVQGREPFLKTDCFPKESLSLRWHEMKK